MKRSLEICRECPLHWTHSVKLHICDLCHCIDYYYSTVIERLPWRNGWDWNKSEKAFESVDVPDGCRMQKKYSKRGEQ